MQANIHLNSRIYSIKKRINVLEWDVTIMAENDLRDNKQKELENCRRELQKLVGSYNKSYSKVLV